MAKRHKMTTSKLLISLGMIAALSGCDLSPEYSGQDLVVPETWQGEMPEQDMVPADAQNTAAAAQLAELPDEWWTLYNDPVLTRLVEQANANNPDLQATAERFQQARDDMMRARAKLMPHFGIMINSPEAWVSWEPDLWSKIRNETRAEVATAQQKAAEYAAARLSLQAEVARHYFTLRGLDAQDANYLQSIAYYQKSLAIVDNRVKGSISPRLDLTRAQALLYSTQAEEIDIRAQREIIEHALAIMVNVSPSSFHIAPAEDSLNKSVPQIPTDVPSTLLKRRPDIASAERLMARTNSLIGAKKAEFFPDIFIQIGTDEPILGIEWPWFEGGMRRAELQRMRSEYREAADLYRGTVLNAFREVEDGLTQVNQLGQQLQYQHDAVQAANETQKMSMELYKGGISNSLEMIVAQVNTLEAHTREIQIQMELLQASTELIRALGGGWESTHLPDSDAIQPFGTLQYTDMEKSEKAGEVETPSEPTDYNDLTREVM